MHRIRNLLGRLRRRCCACRRRIVLVDVAKCALSERPHGLLILKPGARLKHARLVDVDLVLCDDDFSMRIPEKRKENA